MIANEILTTDVPTALASLHVAGVEDVSLATGYPMVRMANLGALRNIVEGLTGKKQVLKQRKDHENNWIEWSYQIRDTTYYRIFTLMELNEPVFDSAPVG